MRFGVAVLTLSLLAGCAGKRPLHVLVIDGNVGAAFNGIAREIPEFADLSVEPLLYNDLLARLQDATRVTTQMDEDVVMLDDPWVPVFAEHLLPLEENRMKVFRPQSLQLCKWKDHLFAQPFVANVQVLFAHAEGGAPTPGTLSQLKDQAKEVRRQHRNYGFAFRGAHGHGIVADFFPLLWAHDGSFNPTANIPMEEAPAARALKFMSELASSGPAEQLGFGAPELREHFREQHCAMQINWLASREFIDNPNEWAAIPSLREPGKPAKAVFSTWALAIPDSVPPHRAALARRFLEELANRSTLPKERNSFLKASSLAKSVPVINQITCEGGILVEAPNRTECIPVATRPRSPEWLEMEQVLSYHILSVLTSAAEASRAIQIANEQIVEIRNKARQRK